jgi:hypothetical protein
VKMTIPMNRQLFMGSLPSNHGFLLCLETSVRRQGFLEAK